MKNIVDSKIVNYDFIFKSILIVFLSLFLVRPVTNSMTFFELFFKVNFKKIVIQIAYFILFKFFVESILSWIRDTINLIYQVFIVYRVNGINCENNSLNLGVKVDVLDYNNPFLYSNKTRALLE